MRDLLKFGLLAALVLTSSCKERQSQSALRDDETASSEFMGNGSYPIWEYDGGPDPQDPMGKELIDLNASIPSFPNLSNAIYGDQMFRPAFGPIPWRMMQKPNSVKMLFIGQDGTHIAEAAGRPATAGFGGRAQDLAKYFGVGSSAAFINTFAFTIRWQYGAFDTPFLQTKDGVTQFRTGAFVGNPVWLISQDLDSPLVKWRNDLISWIIRNNKDSLKMIVLFGGSARDAMGTYIVSKGGKVGTRYSVDEIANIKIPEFDLTGAGSNKQTAFPVSKQGKDLYKEFNGNAMPPYTDPAKIGPFQKKFATAVNQAPDQWVSKMVLPTGGLKGSGMIHEAQLGGYDIDNKVFINGQQTISLKGLQISDDLTIDHDILVAQLPHPTMLSMQTPEQASQLVAGGLEGFAPYVQAGWKIDPDTGFANTFAQGEPYKYSRGDMGTEYYDFGAPNSRMVNVSSASRSGANVIVFGTRDKAGFDQDALKKMGFAKPSSLPPESEMWISRATSTGDGNRRNTFDPGPGVEFAKAMKSSLPRDAEFIKAREVNGDFGHYRGTFKNPKVVIIADPHGEDDLITARALTGSRGQYLNSLMDTMGVGDKYLVFKTAPYSKDAQWADTLEKTKAYRDAVLKKLFESTTPQLIITDGPDATAEFARIFPTPPAPTVALTRASMDPLAGIAEALPGIQAVFSGAQFNGKMLDIPRSHLTYYARVWEGTSGDRVITSNQPQYVGKAFAEVAPKWSYGQAYKTPASEVADCKKLVAKLNEGKHRMGQEAIPAYLARVAAGTPGTANCAQGGDAGEGSAAVATALGDMELGADGGPRSDDGLQHVFFNEPATGAAAQ